MARYNYKTDVALMSVTATEFRAVNQFHDWRAKVINGDDQVYDVAEFERGGSAGPWFTPSAAKWA